MTKLILEKCLSSHSSNEYTRWRYQCQKTFSISSSTCWWTRTLHMITINKINPLTSINSSVSTSYNQSFRYTTGVLCPLRDTPTILTTCDKWSLCLAIKMILELIRNKNWVLTKIARMVDPGRKTSDSKITCIITKITTFKTPIISIKLVVSNTFRRLMCPNWVGNRHRMLRMLTMRKVVTSGRTTRRV